MKYRKHFLIGLPLLLILSGIFLYLSLIPNRHFEEGRVPVLATPDLDQGVVEAEPDDELEFEIKPKLNAFMQSFNILILGTDARRQEISRTDLIMLAHVDLNARKITLVSIPRDTRVKVPDIGLTKINHAHAIGEVKGGNHSGTEAILKAVSNFIQCDINYYVKIDFKGFRDFIDTIGGIDIVLQDSVELTYSQIVLPAGSQHIDGELALKLMKERRSLPDGDFGRQKHHRLLFEALITKLLEPQNVKNLPALYHQVKQDVLDTNFAIEDILSLALAFQGISGADLSYFQIPGHSGFEWDPLVKAKVYYWLPDENKVKDISRQFQPVNERG